MKQQELYTKEKVYINPQIAGQIRFNLRAAQKLTLNLHVMLFSSQIPTPELLILRQDFGCGARCWLALLFLPHEIKRKLKDAECWYLTVQKARAPNSGSSPISLAPSLYTPHAWHS
jgi:hypothetical protein